MIVRSQLVVEEMGKELEITERDPLDKVTTENSLKIFEGKWEQKKEGKPACYLDIKENNASCLILRMRIGNTFACVVKQDRGKLNPGKVKSTHMLIPSSMLLMETRMIKLLNGLKKIERQGNVNLFRKIQITSKV